MAKKLKEISKEQRKIFNDLKKGNISREKASKLINKSCKRK